ncbi:MAG: DUF11 domain-containing protein [Rudaea sp.]|uniref:beta strand repeat-containing protein n=1 Tax=unclassified Rudaea TaxID=2627037 RepID=UPI001AC8218C|nr:MULTISPECIES: Ig-like domain repeat protein [unclassified Rudaea]MBN8885069.1 DUF11 domain-containing protein [Rudaea sp.]
MSAAPVGAAAPTCLTDTTQADFQNGTVSNTDINASPGDVILVGGDRLDQQNTTLGTSGVGITTTTWGGQTFTPSLGGLLTRVDVNLFCSGCTGITPNLTLSLRATVGGLPIGSDLAGTTLTGFSSGSAAFYTATFSSPAMLSAGTQYAIVIRPNINPSPGTYALTRSGTATAGSDVYSGGTRVAGATSGTVWSIPLTGGVSTDAGFRIYINDGYDASGTFDSSVKDANPIANANVTWTTLSWDAATPTNTAVRFQVAGSASLAGPFNFVGPDNTSATYFNNGASLSQFNGLRYLKYRAVLSTSNLNTTPALNDATVCYANLGPSDLAVTVTDGVTTAVPGGSVTYMITASNAGPADADGANVSDNFPPSATCTWTCIGAGGGTCTASGSGIINDTVNLPAGGSTTYTASCAISASASGSLVNTASVTTPTGITDPTPDNNSATDADTLTPQADLAIANTDGVTTATPGGSVTYTITASNAGPSNAPGTIIADTFPAALTCTWTCVGAGGGTCTASGSGNINDTINLPAGGSTTYTASCTISAAASGTLSNTATVAAPAGVTDPTPGNNSATDTDALAASADLAITNTDGVTTATPGGSVTYTITASNAGPSNAPGAVIADTFPAALTCTWTCVGAGGGTCTASGSGNINDTINLPAGGSTTYTASCTISAAASGTLSNTATVAAPAGVTDPTPGNNSATDTDALAASADLAITNTDGVTTATPGGSVTYTITASNAGPSNAPGTIIADTFPAALTCTWTCVGAGGGTCTASGSGNINNTINLPAGGSTTYTASCTISAAASGTLSNTATVAAAAGVTDPTPGNNSATDTDALAGSADLSITNTDGVTTATPGGSVTYTITASNAGPSNAPGAVIADTFPAALTCTWTCVGAGGGTCTASGSGNINDTINLPAGGSTTYTASCTISAAASGTLSNTATVAAPAGVTDPTPGNNSATDTDTLTARADLTITKTHSGNFAQGQTGAIYLLTASNVGGSPTNGTVTVTDTLPAGLTATAIGGTGWSCSLGTLTCTRSDALAAGSSYPAITLTVNVANNAAASVTNNAAVSGGGETNTGNDSASDVTTIAATTYTIGGNVSGATSAAALTLSDSTHGTSQALSSSGAFTFPTPLPIGSNWNVAVTTPPSGQTCVVANGNGTNLSANVTNVQVTCAKVMVTIAPATIAAATFGLSYSQQLSASSSDGVDHTPYTFTLTSGSLPTGLTLSTSGLLAGTPTAAGSFAFTAQAAGSGGAFGTQAYTLVVNKKTTTVTLAATPNPATPGVPLNLVATVAGDPPTGTVSFSDNGTALPCSPVTLIVGTTSSTASCTATFTTPGTHSITASYSGDAGFVQATSSVLAVVVNPVATPTVPAPTLDRWAILMLCALIGIVVFDRFRKL